MSTIVGSGRNFAKLKAFVIVWTLIFGGLISLFLMVLMCGGVKNYSMFGNALGWAGLLYVPPGVIYLLTTPEKDSVWRLLFLMSVLFVAFFAILLVNGEFEFLKALILWP